MEVSHPQFFFFFIILFLDSFFFCLVGVGVGGGAVWQVSMGKKTAIVGILGRDYICSSASGVGGCVERLLMCYLVFCF